MLVLWLGWPLLSSVELALSPSQEEKSIQAKQLVEAIPPSAGTNDLLDSDLGAATISRYPCWPLRAYSYSSLPFNKRLAIFSVRRFGHNLLCTSCRTRYMTDSPSHQVHSDQAPHTALSFFVFLEDFDDSAGIFRLMMVILSTLAVCMPRINSIA